jgi:hypothetical protein
LLIVGGNDEPVIRSNRARSRRWPLDGTIDGCTTCIAASTRGHVMPPQRFERAAPPDDGGSQGSFTKPDEMLLERPEDTRSSELLGNEPPQPKHPNRNLLLLMLATVALAVVMFVIGVYKP